MWECLPDILLENIFSRLSVIDRYSSSQVCWNWFRAFYYPGVWSTFILEDKTLTRRKFNYYTGYQHILDHHRTQICLHKFGHNIRHLHITPMSNFFNLYEFMTIVTYFCENFPDNPLKYIRTLQFTFACDSASSNAVDEFVFGTGGKLLQALMRMMSNLIGLQHLSLEDLLLDRHEAMHLLDDVVQNCCETLRTLKLVNCTKDPHPILHAGVFLNLKCLSISPQHLSEDVVILLGFSNLENLYIVQTRHTEQGSPVSPKAWRECRRLSSRLKVQLVIKGKVKHDVLWQECAPVKSIVYDSPYSQITTQSCLMAAGLYMNYLETYAFLGLPRFHMPKSFQERGDSSLVLIARSCPRMHTMILRELISTATVLLIAYYTPNLKRLIVRKNAIIKRCDWPKNPEWSDDFYQWLKMTSQSYEATADEVSLLLGYRWQPVLDKDFKYFRLSHDYTVLGV